MFHRTPVSASQAEPATRHPPPGADNSRRVVGDHRERVPERGRSHLRQQIDLPPSMGLCVPAHDESLKRPQRPAVSDMTQPAERQ